MKTYYDDGTLKIRSMVPEDAKYDERLRLYHEGIKQWDTSVSLTMIVRGSKQ